jgi:hypothetical protein
VTSGKYPLESEEVDSCVISRARRIKCDGFRPVCGGCLKTHRSCGFNSPNRLILKDETNATITRFQKRHVGCASSSNIDIPFPSTEDEKSALVSKEVMQDIDVKDSMKSFPGSKIKTTPAYEQNQVAWFCYRETVCVKTLSWIMSDEKWVDLLPEMMSRSEALTSVIHANAVSHLAKMKEATSTPRQALTFHTKALKELQGDLYDPIRQTSDETLFAIILLGVFEV